MKTRLVGPRDYKSAILIPSPPSQLEAKEVRMGKFLVERSTYEVNRQLLFYYCGCCCQSIDATYTSSRLY
jgi:hypothetical protein